MKRSVIISFVFALVLVCGPGWAQTVTAGTGGTFPTLSAAILSFETGGSNESNPATNVINCLNASYDELFPTVNVQLTINGLAGRSTLLGQVNAGGDGFSLDPPGSAEIQLNDLILLPSATGVPTDDLIDVIGAATGIITFNRCVVSSNFSGAPLSLDGFTAPTGTPTAQVGDNGLNIAAAASAATVNLNETVVTFACPFLAASTGTPDNILLSGAGKNVLNINAGSVISYGQYRNIQANNVDDLNMIGTKDKPVYIIGADGTQIGLFTTAGGGAVVMDHCIMASALTTTIHVGDTPAGLDIQNPNRPTTITNSLIFNNRGPGIRMAFDAASFPDPAPQVTVQNTTISHNSVGTEASDVAQVQIRDPLGAAATVSFQDTIFAGGKTGIEIAGGTITVSNSALVLLGPDALAAATTGAGTVTQTAVINDDPEFHEIANLTSADLYDVFSSAYAGKGSGGSDLAGGADFRGLPPTPTPLPPTGANTWNLYN